MCLRKKYRRGLFPRSPFRLYIVPSMFRGDRSTVEKPAHGMGVLSCVFYVLCVLCLGEHLMIAAILTLPKRMHPNNMKQEALDVSWWFRRTTDQPRSRVHQYLRCSLVTEQLSVVSTFCSRRLWVQIGLSSSSHRQHILGG